MQAVIIGVADAVVVDLPVPSYLEANPMRRWLLPVLCLPMNTMDRVNKNNVELLEKINAPWMNLNKNGTYAEIYAKWFGANTPAAN